MKRSKYEICADILRATLNGAKKTRIVYAANLNFNLMKRYLPRLTERGFIEATDDGYYLTTPKGIQFLKEYNDLLTLLNDDGSGTDESPVHTQETASDDSRDARSPIL